MSHEAEREQQTAADGPRYVERLVRRLSPEKVGALLIEHGIIQPEAIDDPIGYDGGQTQRRVDALTREIAQTLRYLPNVERRHRAND